MTDELKRQAEELAEAFCPKTWSNKVGTFDTFEWELRQAAYLAGFKTCHERMSAQHESEGEVVWARVEDLEKKLAERDQEIEQLKLSAGFIANSYAAEIERISAMWEQCKQGCSDYRKHNAELKERLRVYEDALTWYASSEAWTIDQVEGSFGDYGDRARKALERGRGDVSETS